MLIAYAVCAFDKETPFPSFYTLIPTVGAALILLCATQQTLVGKMLGSKPLVGIGLISYSAYLWHQPLFVFARHESIEEPSRILLTMLAAVSLMLAYLSWKYVETPFRNKNISSKAVFAFSFAGLLFFISMGVVLPKLKNPYNALTKAQKNIYSYVSYNFDEKARKNKCFLDSSGQSYASFSSSCKKVKKKMPVLLLWGDSHAAALSLGLRPLYRNVIQYTSTNCPPVLGVQLAGARFCQGINNFVVDEIKRIQPNEIVLEAYWYSYGARKLSKLDETIASIQRASPASRITIVGNVPLWPDSLPILLLKRNISLDGDTYLHPPLYSVLKTLDGRLRSIAEKNNIEFVSAMDAFCLGDKCKAITSFGGSSAPTTFDYGHLTEAGSAILAKQLISQNDIAKRYGDSFARLSTVGIRASTASSAKRSRLNRTQE
jgi:hypothetical protein